jgi:hypothetical protein
MRLLPKPILLSSCILISCADPHIKHIRPYTQKDDPELDLDTVNQQPYVEGSHDLTLSCDESTQLTLANAVPIVIQYLQDLQKIPAEYRQEYKHIGKQLLRQVEALKKSQKRACRMADRNFLYNPDISPQGMQLLHEQMKDNSRQLKSLRDLRLELLQNLQFSPEELLACQVKPKPSKDHTQEHEIDSSDEEKLTYSRAELAFRKGGLQGIKQGVENLPYHFLESIKSILLDKTYTVDKMVDYLVETPDVADRIADYMDSIEGNEEEKGKEIGEWITSQILVGVSEICQAQLIKSLSKVKLIKALWKIARASYKKATRTHKLTQMGAKQIGEQLAGYKYQSAQEVLELWENHTSTPPIQHKSYWKKHISELANLAAKGDGDAKTIVEFLKQELQKEAYDVSAAAK